MAWVTSLDVKYSVSFLIWLICIGLCTNGCELVNSLNHDRWVQNWMRLRGLAFTALEHRDYSNAETYNNQAIVQATKIAKTDVRVVISLNDLAELLFTQHRYAQAADTYEKAVALCQRWRHESSQKAEESILWNPEFVRAYEGRANVYCENHEFEKAEPLYKAAIQVARTAASITGKEKIQLQNDYVKLLNKSGRADEAAAVNIDAVFGPTKSMPKSDPSDVWGKELLKSSMALQNNDLIAAEQMALKALKEVQREQPLDEYKIEQTYSQLGYIYLRRRNFALAEKFLRRALKIEDKLYQGGGVVAAVNLERLAGLYAALGRHEQASSLFDGAAAAYLAVGTAFPETPPAMCVLAAKYLAAGDLKKARLIYERAQSVLEKANGRENIQVASIIWALADICRMDNQNGEAIRLYKESLALFEKIKGPLSREADTVRKGLALIYVQQGNYAEAERLNKQTLMVSEKMYGQRSLEAAAACKNLALSYEAQHKYAQAAPLYERALKIVEQKKGANNLEVADTCVTLGTSLDTLGKHTQASKLYKRAVAIVSGEPVAENISSAAMLFQMASHFFYYKRFADAAPLFARSLEIFEKTNPKKADLAQYMNSTAACYLHTGQFSQALPLLNRALEICQDKPDLQHLEVDCLYHLGTGLIEEGHQKEAERIYERAGELCAGQPNLRDQQIYVLLDSAEALSSNNHPAESQSLQDKARELTAAAAKDKLR